MDSYTSTCPVCGRSHSSAARYCPYCGQSVRDPPDHAVTDWSDAELVASFDDGGDRRVKFSEMANEDPEMVRISIGEEEVFRLVGVDADD